MAPAQQSKQPPIEQQKVVAARGEKTRFDEIMSYLGDVEEEFSQMVSNRSIL